MASLAVYDPSMCCSSGVRTSPVNEAAVRFAADLDWIRRRGVAVKRYSLSQQPHAFVDNALVKSVLRERPPREAS